jgi:hypothetical protein
VLAAGAMVEGAVRALMLQGPPDEIPAPRGGALVAPASAAAPRASDASKSDRLILAAVARDPFRPDRTRPPDRYRVPGRSEPVAAESVSVPSVPPLRVLGVAVLADGRGVAAVELPGEPPRLVRVGEEFAGFRLISLLPGEARLESKDTTLVLRLPSPLRH